MSSFTLWFTAFSLVSFTSFFSSVWQTLSFQLYVIYSLWFYDLFHNLMIKSWISSVINFGTILWIRLDPSFWFLSFFASGALSDNCNLLPSLSLLFTKAPWLPRLYILSYTLGAPYIFLSSKTCIYQSTSLPILSPCDCESIKYVVSLIYFMCTIWTFIINCNTDQTCLSAKILF